jgi:RimJ/RimL family protein N-acetyltransferase
MSLPDLQPTLTGPHVIVRPIRSSDWDGMFAAASDPEIWALHPVRDRYTELVFRAFFDSALASGSAFSIVDRKSDRIIGSSRYHDHESEAREIEIGWTFLARPWWGGNTNREVKDLMLGHAFNFVDTVVFWVGETNWRSQRAMEKIGAIRRAAPGIRTLDGKAYSHVVFEIRKSAFNARAGRIPS